MSNVTDWSEFDKKIDIDDLRKLANKSNENAEFKKMDCGEYSVEISSLILCKSKSGSQMVKGRFKIVNGDFEGNCIYMYQVVQHRFQIDICNSFLRSLETHVDVLFEDYEQYADVIKSVWLDVKDRNIYRLNYGRSPSGYDTFKILEVSDAAF